MHNDIGMEQVQKGSSVLAAESDGKKVGEVYPEFVKLLTERQDEVLGRVRDARQLLDEQVVTDPGDVADMSVVDTSADYFLKLANNQKRELVEIQGALDRLHKGAYGTCTGCEEIIPVDRLRRLPYARFCVDCQASMEKQKRVS